MNETKDFPTRVIASISTGVLLCEFSKMHEAAEYLMGHPIWTHQFADRQLVGEMKKMIAAQCAGFPMEAPDWVNSDTYLDHAAQLENEFGPTVRITKGGGLTAMLPTDGIPDRLKDKTIIVSK